MRLVRCPCCGHTFDPDALSPDARALLDHAPVRWKRGKHAPIRLLADLSGMSYRRARAALHELAGHGYVAMVPYRSGRVQYVGVYTMISRSEGLLAA